MAYDLETARRAARERSERPPGGEQPGTPEYDRWVMAWFEAGLDAGDPDLVRRAGGTAAEEGEGGIADPSGAAGPDQWLGKRKPTPRELRKYAKMTGQSEDYARYDDRQLAAWIGESWDVQQGAFFNDFGDRVEKPTESGPKSSAAGYPTGERSGARGGGGGGGGGGAGPAEVAAPENPAVDPRTTPEWLLGSPLAQMLANQGGFLRQFDRSPGDEMAGVRGGVMGGGSIWWQPTPSGGMGRPGNLPGSLIGPSSSTPGITLPVAPGTTGGGKTGPGGDWNRPVSGPPIAAPPLTSVGFGTAPGTTGSKTGAPGDWNRPGSPLTNAMTPLQAQVPRSAASMVNPYSGSSLSGTMSLLGAGVPAQTNPLAGLMAKYRTKRTGWF